LMPTRLPLGSVAARFWLVALFSFLLFDLL
jgi:hypothetical protein